MTISQIVDMCRPSHSHSLSVSPVSCIKQLSRWRLVCVTGTFQCSLTFLYRYLPMCARVQTYTDTHTRAYGHKLRLDMPSLSLPLPIFRYPPPTFAGTFGSFYMPICHNICHERQLINSLTALLGLSPPPFVPPLSTVSLCLQVSNF